MVESRVQFCSNDALKDLRREKKGSLYAMFADVIAYILFLIYIRVCLQIYKLTSKDKMTC